MTEQVTLAMQLHTMSVKIDILFYYVEQMALRGGVEMEDCKRLVHFIENSKEDLN